jgi:hypothetical protein
MSFNPAEIATMLADYENDHNTCMDIAEISQEIYDYTSGYPFLVSRICQHIDEKFGKNWSKDGVQEAVKLLLKEANTLFDDLFKNIYNNENLRELLYDLLFIGKEIQFNIDNPVINLGVMYGFLKDVGNAVRVSNKIFESRIYKYFTSGEPHRGKQIIVSKEDTNEVKKDGKFNMELCLQKFARYYQHIFSERDTEFLEAHGKKIFLMYLEPMLNGGGYYYAESELNDLKRMDLAVQYKSEQFIIELKLWHGEKKHSEAYSQLYEYLAKENADKGFLVTFDFRKEAHKERKAEWVEVDGKQIFDVIV